MVDCAVRDVSAPQSGESKPSVLSLMKPVLHSLGAFLTVASLATYSHATDFFWDGADTTANADGGTGNWDAGVTANWDSLASAGSSVIWPLSSSGNDDAFFGGSAGTVTLSGGVTANSLTFSTAGYSLAGASLTLDGTTPSITNDGAASISSSLIGSAGLNKIGNGTLTLSGTNSGLSGALVLSGATSGNNGGVVISSTAAFGGLSSVDIQNNSFLQLNGATLGSSVSISVVGGGGTAAPQGALRGGSGASVINGAVAIGAGVRLGNLGTSTTFNGAVTATVGSGNGITFRNSNNQGTILTSTSNYWEGSTTLGDGSVYFQNGAFPTATNLVMSGSANTWFETNGTFSRAIGTAANQIQFNATAARINGFSARGGDLTMNLGGGTALTWGTGGFVPGILGLAGANATGTLTWQNAINLGAATRIVDVANGSAATDAIISGVLSNGTLQVQGAGNLTLSGNNTLATITKGASGSDTGTLTLSGSNTFSTTTLAFGTASQNRGAIRLENNNALGGVTTINGSTGTGSSIAQIQLANNVTISGITYQAGGRSSVTTTGASIVNVSANNTWGGTISITNTGGSYGIRSDAGQLTLSGNLRNGLGSTRVWTLGGSGNIAISGTITNGGASPLGLDKFGSGTMTITGNSNTFTGGVTMSGGTLLANNASGSALGTGSVNVSGGTIGGTGAFTGALTINTTGVLSPGASIETLGTGALTLNTGSTFAYEINTTAVTGDVLNVNGNLDLNGTVTLNLTDLGSGSLLADGTKFTLISYAGTWTAGDVFNGYADGAVFSMFNNDWIINYDDTSAGSVNGGDFANAVTLTAVPEPSVFLLAGLGLLPLLRRRR